MKIICTECPKGCNLQVEYDDQGELIASGFSCPKGQEYAFKEYHSPERMLTSTVKCSKLSLARFQYGLRYQFQKKV